METFKPKINRVFIKDSIFETEGGDYRIISEIRNYLDNHMVNSFFETYIEFCALHQVIYTSYIVDNHFKITIYLYKQEWFTMSYIDKKKDISEELSGALFDALRTSILNAKVIEEAKRNGNL